MATINQISGGAKGRATGFKFEEVLTKLYSGIEPANGMDLWKEKKTTSKTDRIFNNKRCSIKNSENSTQIQVCSAERFNRKFNLPSSALDALNKFVGNHPKLLTASGYKNNLDVFKEVCLDWDVNLVDLSPREEARRGRLVAKNINNMSHLLDWLDENKEEVSRFVLAESFNHPDNTDNIADTVWWASKKNDPNSILEFDIEEIISKIKSSGKVVVRQSETVIEVGPLTLQMKGSGKGSAYHNMQFNMSLADLQDFMKEE